MKPEFIGSFSYRLNRLNWTNIGAQQHVGKPVNELNSSIKALNVELKK